MQLLGRLEIKSRQKMVEFLNQEHVGRIASIDKSGFPQIIPMNFVFTNDVIYMHSHTRGEKIENVKNNNRVGFEVDREIEFLPSYFSSPTDASQADTLYISVVIKGTGTIVENAEEKAMALNALMEKYQPEGRYERISSEMKVIDEVAIIKIIPTSMKGKYKIGQHIDARTRTELARRILERNPVKSKEILKIMGFEVIGSDVRLVEEPVW